jgi:hypothetical protein
VAIISNAPREHERHGARSTADVDHAHAGADRRVYVVEGDSAFRTKIGAQPRSRPCR